MKIKSLDGQILWEGKLFFNDSLRAADLAGANLAKADLRLADLTIASLPGANLSNANLSGADLMGADLRQADLKGANLREADLMDANLSGADLTGADLSNADLTEAILLEADLTGANFTRANLTEANFNCANLSRTNFTEATLARTSLRDANTRDALFLDEACPCRIPPGDIVGWKKCRSKLLVKLLIPAAARRSHATGNKCRAQYAIVLEVLGANEAVSIYDRDTVYRPGETVRCHEWCTDRWTECGGGIHFFLTRDEAEDHLS